MEHAGNEHTPPAVAPAWHEQWRPPMPPPPKQPRYIGPVIVGVVVAILVVGTVASTWLLTSRSTTTSDPVPPFDRSPFTVDPDAPADPVPAEVAPPVEGHVDFSAVNATYEPEGALPPGPTLEPAMIGAPGARAQVRITGNAALVRVENTGPGWVNVGADLLSPTFGRRALVVPERGIPPGSAGLFRFNGLGADNVRADDSGTFLVLIVSPDATRPETFIDIEDLKSLRPAG